MSGDRSRNAVWNYLTKLLFTAVTLAVGLFSSPLIESWVGSERFGAFRTLSESLGYLMLLELGLGGAMSPSLARALGRGDAEGVRHCLAVGVRLYTRVALSCLGIGLALVAAIPWIVPVDPATVADLRLGCALSLVSYASLPLLPFKFLVEARQRGFTVNLLLIVQALVIVGLSMLLSWAFPAWGISGQAVALMLGTVGINLTLALMLWRSDRALMAGLFAGRPPREAYREIAALSWPSLVLNLASRLSYFSDNLVLAQTVGVGAVTILFFTQRLAVLGQGQLSSIGSATWAGLAELHNRGEHATFRDRLLELLRLITVMAVAGLGPTILYGRAFVTIWKGPAYFGGEWVLAAASANALLLSLLTQSAWCLTGTGRVRMLAMPMLGFGMVNLACSVFLSREFGMVGVLLGTTVAVTFLQVPYHLYLLRREFGVPVASTLRAVAAPLGIGLAYFLGLAWLIRGHQPVGWAGLLTEMALSALGSLAIAFAIVLSPDQRRVWKDRLARSFRLSPRAAARQVAARE